MSVARPSVRTIVVPGARAGTTVNAYLLDGPVPTLVDGGPRTVAAEGAVRDALATAGMSVTDVRRIVVTGSAPERIGLVARIVAVSGARVAAHPLAVRALTDWPAECADRADLLERVGTAGAVPVQLLNAATAVARANADAVDPVPAGVIEPTRHGLRLRAGASAWVVHHMPGRARDLQGLLHESSGSLLCGDLLARDRQTWPDLAPSAADGRRPDALGDLVAAWRALGTWRLQVAWPACGRPIRAHRILIAHQMAAVHARVRSVSDALEQGAETIWEVTATVGPAPGPDDLAETLGGVVAVLDWLVRHGRASRRVASGSVRFAPAPGAGPDAGA